MQRSRAEQLDAGLHVRSPPAGQLLRRRRPLGCLVVEQRGPHHHAAQLHRHVRALRQFRHRRLPGREHLVAPAGIGAVAQHPADMAHDDVRAGEGTRQIDHVRQLRMEHPGVQRQPQRAQPGQARPEIRAPVDVRSRRAVADDRVGVPVAGVANAAEPAATGPDVRLQHRLDAVAQREIGVAHDAGGNPGGPVAAAVAHRGDAGDELGLPHRPHLLGTAARGTWHGIAGTPWPPRCGRCADLRANPATSNDDPGR